MAEMMTEMEEMKLEMKQMSDDLDDLKRKTIEKASTIQGRMGTVIIRMERLQNELRNMVGEKEDTETSVKSSEVITEEGTRTEGEEGPRIRGKQPDESREEGGEVDNEDGFLTGVDPLADHSYFEVDSADASIGAESSDPMDENSAENDRKKDEMKKDTMKMKRREEKESGEEMEGTAKVQKTKEDAIIQPSSTMSQRKRRRNASETVEQTMQSNSNEKDQEMTMVTPKRSRLPNVKTLPIEEIGERILGCLQVMGISITKEKLAEFTDKQRFQLLDRTLYPRKESRLLPQNIVQQVQNAIFHYNKKTKESRKPSVNASGQLRSEKRARADKVEGNHVDEGNSGEKKENKKKEETEMQDGMNEKEKEIIENREEKREEKKKNEGTVQRDNMGMKRMEKEMEKEMFEKRRIEKEEEGKNKLRAKEMIEKNKMELDKRNKDEAKTEPNQNGKENNEKIMALEKRLIDLYGKIIEVPDRDNLLKNVRAFNDRTRVDQLKACCNSLRKRIGGIRVTLAEANAVAEIIRTTYLQLDVIGWRNNKDQK